jgi:hypothetical protein
VNQITWRSEDQFDSFIYPPDDGSNGFNFIQLRKKQKDPNPDAYEYRIGKDAGLEVQIVNYSNIITPKPPGEWIDITLKEKKLYLYLECLFSVKSRNEAGYPIYKISSAKLITTEEDSLPNNFSGTRKIVQDNQGYNYYEISLGRRLLAIFAKYEHPIMIYKCPNINLISSAINGLTKPRI